MHSCILCKNSSIKPVDRYITFHSFPRNPVRRSNWLRSLHLTECTDWQRVCSDHFDASDFRPGIKRLLWSSVCPKLPSEAQNNMKMIDENTQLEIMDQLKSIRESLTSADDSMDTPSGYNEFNSPRRLNLRKTTISTDSSTTINSSVTQFDPLRRSSRKIKPVTLSDDSTYSTSSLISSDQDEIIRDKIPKKRKKIKESATPIFRCSVKNCPHKYPISNVSFFGYPNDESIRKIWFKNCGIESDLNATKAKSRLKVCGCHFENDMFLNNDKKNRLVANAIPTIFNNKDTSQLLSPENKSIENDEDSSKYNDNKAIKSSKLVNSKDIQEFRCEKPSGKDTGVNACCIPGCIYSADYLNENPNSNPKPVALFAPPDIGVANEWSSVVEIPLTVKTKVCERHFKSDQINSRDIFFTDTGLGKVKSLKEGAMPIKIKKYGGKLKRSRINNVDENISAKKNKISADRLKIDSKFGDLPEDENIEVIESDIPSTILNQTDLNHEPNDSFSNSTTNTSTGNNSHSNLENILPKILANNSLSISLQPNVVQSKQVLTSESTEVTNKNSELNQNEQPSEDLSVNSPNNSILTPLQSNVEQLLSKQFVNNSSLSITVEKNTNQSLQKSIAQSTGEKNNPACVIKDEPIDEALQTISTDDSNKDEFHSQSYFEQTLLNSAVNSSVLKIQETKQVFTDKGMISLSDLSTTFEVKSEPIDDVPQTTLSDSLQSSTEKLFLNTPVSNSNIAQNEQVSTSQSSEGIHSNLIIKPEPIDYAPTTSVDDSQSNAEQLLSTSSSNILLNALQSSKNVSKTPIGNSISSSQLSKCIPNDQEQLITHRVPDSLLSIETHSESRINNNQMPLFNLSNNVSSDVIDISDEVIPPKLREINTLKDFLIHSKNVILPSQFWVSYYNSTQNSAVFIQRDEFNCPIKRVYFRDNLVPVIYINSKPYEYKDAVKTLNDLENLLEDIDGIQICSGFDGYSHETCLGFFESTSEEIEVCRNCQHLIKGKFMHRMDMAIKTKTNALKRLKNKIAEMQVRVSNARKRLLKEKQKGFNRNINTLEDL